MTKALTSTDLNDVELEMRTHGKWKGEVLEPFACASCGALYLGIPDCHLFLSNPFKLDEELPYNLPRKTHCPKCKAIIHDPHNGGSGSRPTTREEIEGSDWKWILR